MPKHDDHEDQRDLEHRSEQQLLAQIIIIIISNSARVT